MAHRTMRLAVAFLVTQVTLAATLAKAQGLALDAIQPGKSKSTDLRSHLGQPVRSERAGDLTVEHFEAKEKLLKEVAGWFSADGVLQWARVVTVHKLRAEDAALLLGSTSELEETQGNAFTGSTAADGKTSHDRAGGMHFYVRAAAVEEIWLTLPDADPAQIQAQLKPPSSPKTVADNPKLSPPSTPEPKPRPREPAPPKPPPPTPPVPRVDVTKTPMAAIRPARPGAEGPSFRALVVGRSTRADAEKVLGPPKHVARSVEGQVVTTHDGSKLGLREVVVRYKGENVVDGMALVPGEPQSPEELTRTLGLGQPDRTSPSGAALIRCYDAAGIRLAVEQGQVTLVSLCIPRGPAPPPPAPPMGAWFGICFQPLEPALARQLLVPSARGIVVTAIHEGSPASQAGLFPEDIVTTVAGVPVETGEAIRRVLSGKRPGQEVTVSIIRDSRPRELPVRLAAWPRTEPPIITYGTADIGLTARDPTSAEATQLALTGNQGAIIDGLVPDCPASRAGLRPGDVLVAFNRQRLSNAGDYRRLIERCRPGDAVELTIRRGQQLRVATPRAEAWSEPNAGSVSALVQLPDWGLSLRELNRATAAHLGMAYVPGFYIEGVGMGHPAAVAKQLSGAVIVRMDGVCAHYLEPWKRYLAQQRTVRLLVRRGSDWSIVLLVRP